MKKLASPSADCNNRSSWISGISRRVVDERLSWRQQMAAEMRIAVRVEIWLILAIGRIDETFRRARLRQIRAIIKKIRAVLRVLPPDRPGAPGNDHALSPLLDRRRIVRQDRVDESRAPPDSSRNLGEGGP
jgi:hypothetical protein